MAQYTHYTDWTRTMIRHGSSFIPVGDNNEYQRLIASGVAIEDPPAVPPVSAKDYEAAIQAHIDATARAKGYADGVACASYKDDPFPLYSGEAAAFIAWRSAVWQFAYAYLAAVLAGQRAQPTVAGLVAELPAIAWP